EYAGNAGSGDLAGVSRRFASHARLPRAHNGLGPVRDIQLVEDAIDVIANGFGTKRQLARDRGVVEPASDQFEDLALTHGKIAKCGPGRNPGLAENETSDLGQELLPCRLVLQQNVIATLQRDEFSAGNRTRNHATFRERYASVVSRVQHQRRTIDLR